MRKIFLRAAAMAVLILTIWAVPVMAEEPATFGTCGPNLRWEINSDLELVISGFGPMYDYQGYEDENGHLTSTAPWQEESDRLSDEENHSIEAIILPEGMTTIGDYAFVYLTSHGEITIPSSVVTIGDYAFYGNQFSGDLTIPGSVKEVGNHAFYCGFRYSELILIEGLEIIGDAAFCGGFEGDLYIPNTVKTIGNSAFGGNFEGNLRIPDSVISIGDGAFSNCYSSYWGIIGTLTLGNGLKTIGANAFEHCEFTGSLVIPDSVEIIGDHAFGDCSAFDGTLTLGKGLRTIGEFAFHGCEGFTGDLIIPDNVKTIKKRAFKSCAGFNGNLIIGNGLFRIEEGVFYECTGFQGNLVLSDSLRSIGAHAFADCSGLTGDLKIPYYVTDIEKYAFGWCGSLNGKLELPNSLKTIGEWAFCECAFTGDLYMPMNVTEIEPGALNDAQFDSIKFMGNAPTVTPAEEWNSSFSPDVTLYYSEAASGWTSPTWNGYKTATWVPSGFIEVEIQNVPATYYNLLLQDSEGNPVVGAEVTWNEQSEKSDSEGMVSFWHDPDEVIKISVELEGFQKKIIENYTALEKGYDTIRCYRNEESGLYLGIANFRNSSHPEDRADLLMGFKRLVIIEGVNQLDAEFNIECQALASEIVKKYILYQGNNEIAESKDGSFEGLKILQFKDNEEIYVRVYDEIGQYADTLINLQFVEDHFFADYKFDLEWKEIKFTVPDDVPFFGGGEVSCDLPELPVMPEIYIDGDTVRFGFFIPLDADPLEWFSDAKDSFSQLEKFMGVMGDNPKLNKNLKEQLKEIAGEGSGEIPFLDKIDIGVIFFGEGKYDYGGNFDYTVNLGLFVEYEDIIRGPIWVVKGVPISTLLDIEAQGSRVGSVLYKPEVKKYIGNGMTLNLSPDVAPYVGAGLYDIISGGAYGSLEFPMAIQVIPSVQKSQGITVDWIGDAGLKLYVLTASFEKAFATSELCRIYPREKTSSIEMMGADWNMYDLDNYTLADTSYLSNESSWLGGDELMLMDLEQTGIQKLQTSTYRNMQPQIVSIGEDLVMVWTGVDTSREAYNLTQLKYSIFDGISWSEPQSVDSNETADYLHNVYSDGENLWVVYQESATAFDAEPSMEEAAADMQIVVAKFDTATGGFTDHTVLSNEGGYESIPSITVVEGKPYAVWTSNSDTTDLFGQNDTNEIHYAEFDGEWSTAQVLADGLGPVTNLTAGDMEGEAAVAFVSSEDSSLETDDDNMLYTAAFGEEVEEVSDGIISALKFAELPDASESSLVWYDNGKLKTLQDGDVETVIENGTAFAAGFDVLSDRIIFNHATDGASDVFASIYEDGEYQEPVRMTYQDRYIQSYSFVEHDSKAYAALVQTDVTITEDAVEDDCTLSFLTFEGVTDVSLESAAYDDADLVAGTDLPIEVILKNNGDTLIEEVDITILDEDDEVCASVTETIDLAAYEEVILTVDLPIGNTIRKQIYTVSVTADNDANADNNSWQILVGDEMLSVSGEMIRSGSNVKAIVKVLNDGHETTGGTLTISSVSDGTVLIEKELAELAAGESHLMILDGEYLLNGKDSDVLQLEVQTTAGNNYSANRIQQMYISRAIVTEEAEENKITISEVDGNVIGIEISNAETVDLAAAVYDANGKMLAYDISTDIVSSIYNYETFIMDLDEISSDQKVKVFMLKAGTEEPLCEVAEL